MSPDPQQLPMFRIDVSADASSGRMDNEMDTGDLIVALLRQVVANQEQQNQLFKELNHQLSAAQRQRAQELGQWKARILSWPGAAGRRPETLSRVQTQFLQNLTKRSRRTRIA